MFFTLCPCCSSPMLHHIGNHREYWFCRSCWQEMPNLSEIERNNRDRQKPLVSLSTGWEKLPKKVLA